MPSSSFGGNSQYGGSDSKYFGMGAITDWFGRQWNNLTGKTSSNNFTAEEAEKARLFNSSQAMIERNWQTEMSNTAYQRAAADMKAAGINPASLGGDGTMQPASTGNSARAAASPSASAASGGSSFLDIALGALKMAVWKNISNSSLEVERNRDTVSKVLSDARAADYQANTALKMERLGKREQYQKTLDDFRKAQEKEFDRLMDPNRTVS